MAINRGSVERVSSRDSRSVRGRRMGSVEEPPSLPSRTSEEKKKDGKK